MGKNKTQTLQIKVRVTNKNPTFISVQQIKVLLNMRIFPTTLHSHTSPPSFPPSFPHAHAKQALVRWSSLHVKGNLNIPILIHESKWTLPCHECGG